MSSDFRVEGLEKLRTIAHDLRAIDERKLIRKEFNASLRKDLGEALQPHTSAAALARLPQRGGLAALVAKSRVTVKVNSSSHKWAGVDVVAGRKGSGAGGADKGDVRHPLFGDRERWYGTKTAKWWFTQTVNAHMDDIVAPIVDKALQGLLDKVGSGRL